MNQAIAAPRVSVAAAARGAGQESSALQVAGLSKHFRRNDGTIVSAIDDVSFEVAQGEFVVLLGPSGCGKTTLLRTVAGLEYPDNGRIILQGRPVFDSSAKIALPPEKRSVSMIFQSYALWPHMNTFDNVAYPLVARRLPSAEIKPRVDRVLELVGIPHLAKQYPSAMSGGQQQRVAFARAIVSQDRVVLFDEPLSNVDAKVREQLRLELLSMQRQLGFSALYVTHDQVEAMELAHRIAVMGNGRIAQFATPREIYDRPNSRYVAGFIGTINELECRRTGASQSGLPTFDTRIGTIEIGGSDGLPQDAEGSVLIRPEKCRLSLTKPDGNNAWRGVVTADLYVGTHTEYVVDINGVAIRTWTTSGQAFGRGADIWVSAAPGDCLFLRRDR